MKEIGDLQIIDHGLPFGIAEPGQPLQFDEYDMQKILELAERIKAENLYPSLPL